MKNLESFSVKKLLIIDGHNLLFQMFYGMPSRIINKDGKAYQGVLGFIGALIKIIKMTNPTHLVVLFDSEHKNFRSDLLEEYKSNRIDYSDVPDEDNPFSQLEDVYNALDFLRIKHTEAAVFETDDVIASYALAYGNDMQIIISSFDSDFFQLINNNVFVLRYRGVKTIICDTEYIKDKYGILPAQYADFKSLTGDNSDNIKGAEKIGLKTAGELLNQFGNLENIINQSQLITRPSIKESIQRNTRRLRNNYKIIMLDEKAEIPFTLEELVYSYDGLTTAEVLRGIHLK